MKCALIFNEQEKLQIATEIVTILEMPTTEAKVSNHAWTSIPIHHFITLVETVRVESQTESRGKGQTAKQEIRKYSVSIVTVAEVYA